MAGMTATELVESPSWRPEPMSERVVVRCYSSYQDAKRAVDRLAVARIPPKRITVFGRGFRWRQAFSGPRFLKASSAGGAALAAAAALILWSLGGLASGFGWPAALAAGGALGAVLGLALGAAAWMVTRHDGAIPETGHVDVDHYEVLVELDHADRARELLDD
jgi:hypothetical protein